MSDSNRVDDAVRVSQRALSRCGNVEDAIDELRERMADLEDRVAAQELRLSEHEEDTSYGDLSRDEKIGRVREHAFERATDTGGKTALDYDDIRWGVFDGEPSPSHCYDLMRWAAEAEGFKVRNPENGNRHLAVDAEEAKRALDLLAAKNRPRREGVN